MKTCQDFLPCTVYFEQWPHLIMEKAGPINVQPAKQFINPTRAHTPLWT